MHHLLARRRRRVCRSRYKLSAARNNPLRNLLARSIYTRDSPQPIKRRRVLSGKVNILVRHPVSDYLYITRRVRHPDLKIAVAAIAGEFVVAPLRRQEANGCARYLRVSRKPEIIRLEEGL